MSDVSSISPWFPTLCAFFLFFFNDTATTEIYTLSLHDALPILQGRAHRDRRRRAVCGLPPAHRSARRRTIRAAAACRAARAERAREPAARAPRRVALRRPSQALSAAGERLGTRPVPGVRNALH